MQQQVYNFGAGPAMLPQEVMQQAQQEFLDWHGIGISIIESSHRSEAFLSVARQTEADLRELLNVPKNYKILFLHGGASSQFAMVPLNLLANKNQADYLETGTWSGRAIKEAKRFCQVNIVTSSAPQFTTIPEPNTWSLDPNAAYVYYAENETIHGIEFQTVPQTGDVPLISDMTSSLLSRPLDVSRYGVIFAGVQKNIGSAGLAIVIVREDLLGQASNTIPSMYDYAIHAEYNSMYNTPPTYNWYMAGLVLQWTKQQGGISVMEQRAKSRSGKLYQIIDNSDFYHNAVSPKHRSRINIPFTLNDKKLEKLFLSEAAENGLLALRGHNSVGGIRASMYNAMPEKGVEALIAFMQDFEQRKG